VQKDSLLPENVLSALRTLNLGTPYHYLEEVGSTNDFLVKQAHQGAAEGTLVVAGQQVTGRGRHGRNWVSPPGGLYLSVLLRPESLPGTIGSLVPLAAAVAVAQTVEELGGTASLKWPNDLLIDGRKAAGILVESSFMDNRLEYIVVGAGINVTLDEEYFDEDLRGKVTALSREITPAPGRAEILVLFLRNLHQAYDRLNKGRQSELLADYRRRCSTIGTTVRVLVGDAHIAGSDAEIAGSDAEIAGGGAEVTGRGAEVTGRAIAVDDSGALVVDDGTAPVSLTSGTIVESKRQAPGGIHRKNND